jgi:hypothetical protein
MTSKIQRQQQEQALETSMAAHESHQPDQSDVNEDEARLHRVHQQATEELA